MERLLCLIAVTVTGAFGAFSLNNSYLTETTDEIQSKTIPMVELKADTILKVIRNETMPYMLENKREKKAYLILSMSKVSDCRFNIIIYLEDKEFFEPDDAKGWLEIDGQRAIVTHYAPAEIFEVASKPNLTLRYKCGLPYIDDSPEWEILIDTSEGHPSLECLEPCVKRWSEEVPCLVDSVPELKFYDSPIGFDAATLQGLGSKPDLAQLKFCITGSSPLRHRVKICKAGPEGDTFIGECWVDKMNICGMLSPIPARLSRAYSNRLPWEIDCQLASDDMVPLYASPNGAEPSMLISNRGDSIQGLKLWFSIKETSALRHKVNVYKIEPTGLKFIFDGWVDKAHVQTRLRPIAYANGTCLLDFYPDRTMGSKELLPNVEYGQKATVLDIVWNDGPYAQVMFPCAGSFVSGYIPLPEKSLSAYQAQKQGLSQQ